MKVERMEKKVRVIFFFSMIIISHASHVTVEDETERKKKQKKMKMENRKIWKSRNEKKISI